MRSRSVDEPREQSRDQSHDLSHDQSHDSDDELQRALQASRQEFEEERQLKEGQLAHNYTCIILRTFWITTRITASIMYY